MQPIYLGVNVDHVATLRQARLTNYPDPLHAAFVAEQAGADLITIHLREDRRHIVDQDVINFKNSLKTRLNLEISTDDSMITIAEHIKPTQCCLVPEHRAELTTEGGLDVVRYKTKVTDAVARLKAVGIRVSLFVDPDFKQIQAAKDCGADDIEIHTGVYAESVCFSKAYDSALNDIKSSVQMAKELNIGINAGHGLHYHNTAAIAAIDGISELNIGHAIVARAIISGMAEAVSTMKQLMISSRYNK